MKLWRISQTERDGFDTFDCAVVVAADEASARATHPIGSWWHRRVPSGMAWRSDTWVDSPDKVQAEMIGTAMDGAEPGVVLASFRAG